jgi:hypothetical protein
MHYIVNENISIDKTSWVLTNGFLSLTKEVGADYGEDSRDDDSNTQGTSIHPLVHLNTFRF